MTMVDSDALAAAWARVEAGLPPGWSLEALRCASSGLRPDQRSQDWVAVAVGPDSAERQASAGDPIEALEALAASFELGDEGVRASVR